MTGGRTGYQDVAVVMDLGELFPVGGRPGSWQDRRRFERFAEVWAAAPQACLRERPVAGRAGGPIRLPFS